MSTGRHRRGHAQPGATDRSATTTDETGTASDAVDPDWLDATQADTSSDEHNRDLGASPEVEGIPETADESTPGTGEVPEPERPVVPTDEATGSEAYGTTAREQAGRGRLENQLAAEETEEWAAEERASGERSERPDAGGPGIHVEEERP